MKIEFEIDGNVREKLSTLRDEHVSRARREMLDDLTREVLTNTISENPIDTGRSRRGWRSALSQVGGAAGAQAGDAGEGIFTRTETDSTTANSATNTVPYIVFLEYGTSKMAPFAMLRKSLAKALSRIPNLFRL